jgi:hypothetical protein
MTNLTSSRRTSSVDACRATPVRLVGLLLLLLSSAGAACQHNADRSTPPSPEWLRDSTKYVADSAKFVHDSGVRDSLSRMVNTDSLYRLYRRMLAAADPVPVMALVGCELGRLSWTYGGLPVDAAVMRMEDTLWRRSERDSVKRMWGQVSNMSVEDMAKQGLSPKRCGWRTPQMPRFFNGTDLLALPGRPQRPKRP